MSSFSDNNQADGDDLLCEIYLSPHPICQGSRLSVKMVIYKVTMSQKQ